MGRGKRGKTPTASLDYAALDKPLTQWSERQPPNRRRTAADVLKPVCERVLAAARIPIDAPPFVSPGHQVRTASAHHNS